MKISVQLLVLAVFSSLLIGTLALTQVTKTTTDTQAKPKPPQPAQSCFQKKLTMIPSSKEHIMKFIMPNNNYYTAKNFIIGWNAKQPKVHPFFKWVDEYDNLSDQESKKVMKCQRANEADYAKICNFKPEVIKKYIGSQEHYKCVVPPKSFVASIEFSTRILTYPVSPKAVRNIFAGLNYYTDQNDASKKISNLVREINDKIVSTKLNSFDVSYNLDITPKIIGDHMAQEWNNQRGRDHNIDPNSKIPIYNGGNFKILPPGTNVIVGQPRVPKSQVFTICHNIQSIKENCHALGAL